MDSGANTVSVSAAHHLIEAMMTMATGSLSRGTCSTGCGTGRAILIIVAIRRRWHAVHAIHARHSAHSTHGICTAHGHG